MLAPSMRVESSQTVIRACGIVVVGDGVVVADMAVGSRVIVVGNKVEGAGLAQETSTAAKHIDQKR